MKLLNRDEILAANDRPFEDVPLPELGPDVAVRVQTMTGAQRDDWDALITANTVAVPAGEDAQGGKLVRHEVKLPNLRALLVSRCAVDEGGKLLFSEADVEALGQKSFLVLNKLVAACQRVNKIGTAELEAERGK